MLHLVYTFRPTAHARTNLQAFWRWIGEREAWFYDGLDMARDSRWYVRTIGQDVHALEHFIAFEDEAAWGAYRREVARRSRDAAWERRRVEQDLWWEITEARLLNDAPVKRPTAGGHHG
ncbi:hypothetical protein [Chelativorans intermedius]|uniref:NIPSNAP protein n=1 Tax=Chelativorans intermedius TaxID=515947 RepID=A0ABV6D3F1_9HYPH|nr:hypothetical protein [Chelativorans intermedius]MCT8998344.1 hypothetical protein [Chelativorans intermedius]